MAPVLSYTTWQRHFHADPAVIGTAIELRSRSLVGQMDLAGRLLTVVGVMPANMRDPAGSMDFYVPAVRPADADNMRLSLIIGRLADGVTIEDASREADVIGRAIRPPRPDSAPPLARPRFEVERLKDDVVAGLRPALRVFLAAVAVVLLIVCANVANLLLARGTTREREMAVRLAIGASRARIARQILTECGVLALAGGALGATLGAAGVALVKRLATVEAPGIFRLIYGETLLPRANEVNVDWLVLAVALGLATLTSVVFGLLPALHLSRTSHLEAMGARGAGSHRRGTRFRTALVVVQLTMATMLLVGAGLLVHSFVNLTRVEKGYDPTNVLAFQLVLPTEYSTARKTAAIEALLARLRSMPNVTTAGFSYAGVLLGVEDTAGSFVPAGWPPEDASVQERPRLRSVSRGYLESVGVRLLDGRLFDEQDGADAPPAVVVNRAVARRYFGGRSPVGAQMDWHGSEGAPLPVEIVGVIEDVRQGALSREPPPEILIDYRQLLTIEQQWGASKAKQEHLALGFLSFAVRTTNDPAASIPLVRAAIDAVDGNAGLDAILPMTHLLASSLARQRFYAVMLGAFASVAGLLAAIGIYGVLAYAVVQRTQEIGVRMALGARRGQLLRLVLQKGLLLAGAGIAIGLVGAAASATYLRSLLFGLEPLDASTFAIVAGGFAIVAAFASYLPARRATLVDPMVTLRID